MSLESNGPEEVASSLEVLQPAQPIPATASSRLEQLPAELISLVFVHLYQSFEKHKVPLIKDPISKSLLPYIRRNLFQNLVFSTLARFVEFCEMVKGKVDIVGSVQRFEIVQGPNDTSELSSAQESTILDFFAHAQSIRRFQSIGAVLSAFFVTGRFARNLPQNSLIEKLVLRRLVIEKGSFGRTMEPVLSWRSLRALDVEYKHGVIASSGGGRSEERETAIQRHDNIVLLRLVFPHADQDSADFVANFPKLKSAFFYSSSVPEFAPVLESLSDTVTKLKLGTIGSNKTLASPAVANHSLLKFRNLQSLILDANVLTPSFVDMICQQLPVLRTLTLLPKSAPEAADVEKIIKNRPSSLKSVLLQHLRFTEGSQYAMREYGRDIEWDPLPVWYSTFDFDDAYSLQQLALRERVSLGKAFDDAVQTVENLEEHLAMCNEAGDFEYDEAVLAEMYEAMME